MRGVILLILGSALLLGLGVASSDPPDRVKIKGKVAVCHQTEPDSTGAVEPPHVIIIAGPAVRAHVENHGDCILAPSDTLKAGEPCDCSSTPLPQF
jgi:hypothetical protein